MTHVETKSTIDHYFHAKSIAIVGVSRKVRTWSFFLLHNLMNAGYDGKIYPVNPKGDTLLGLKVYPSIREIPSDVDVAIILVPASTVAQVIEDCSQKKVKLAQIITAGFHEAKERGADENKIIEIAHSSGMRLIGPNSMGFLSAPSSINAVMVPMNIVNLADNSPIALVSQSGNLGVYLMTRMMRSGVIFNKFVSSGNECDLRTSDFIQDFADDPKIRVILACMEGTRNGRELFDVCQYATKKKPVIICRGGKTSGGARAALSHTGAMASSNQVFSAALKQAGVIEVQSIEEMVDTALAFTYQPLPTGRNVAIITRGGGSGVLAADACTQNGLNISQLTSDTLAKIDKLLPPYWSRGNPIDTVGSPDTTAFLKSLEILLTDSEINSILLLGFGVRSFFARSVQNSTLITAEEKKEILADEDAEVETAKVIPNYVKRFNKPILMSGLGEALEENLNCMKPLKDSKIFSYSDPIRVVQALAKMWQYSQYLNIVHARSSGKKTSHNS